MVGNRAKRWFSLNDNSLLCEGIIFGDSENPFIFLNYRLIELKIVLHHKKNQPIDHCKRLRQCL